VRRRPRDEHWYKDFLGRRPIAKGFVWADGIVRRRQLPITI
jgi:hypothetical protein